MTPHYLRSAWCRQELSWWSERTIPTRWGSEAGSSCAGYGQARRSCGHRADSRRLLPLRSEQGPDKARPFIWRGGNRDLDDYNDLLVDLAGDLMQRLREVRAALTSAASVRGGQRALPRRWASDLSSCPRTHAEAWERVSDLLRRGFVVLPTEPDPIAHDPTAIREIAEHRVETMSGSDGLLLLGTQDGRALDADLVVVGRQDRHSARARTDCLLPCGVLDTAGGAIATARRKATARALGIEWIDAARDLWPSEVKSWLNEASAVMERA